MLGCVHPLKALDEAASFRCWKGLVERRLGVDVQVLSPAFEGGEHHEEVGDAVALVLVVMPGRAGLSGILCAGP